MFLLLFLSVTTSLLRGVVGFSERFKTTQTAIIGVTEIWEVQRDKPIFKDSTFFYFLLFFFAKFWFCFQNLAFLLLIYFSFSFWGLMRKRRSGWFKEEGVLAGLLGISLFFIAILVLRWEVRLVIESCLMGITVLRRRMIYATKFVERYVPVMRKVYIFFFCEWWTFNLYSRLCFRWWVEDYKNGVVLLCSYNTILKV